MGKKIKNKQTNKGVGVSGQVTAMIINKDRYTYAAAEDEWDPSFGVNRSTLFSASSSRFFLFQTSQCLRGLCMEKGRMHVMALGAGSQYFLEEWESRSSMRWRVYRSYAA